MSKGVFVSENKMKKINKRLRITEDYVSPNKQIFVATSKATDKRAE